MIIKNINHISKITFLLGLGLIGACSSEINNKPSELQQSNQILQPQPNALYAHIDPVSGELLDSPHVDENDNGIATNSLLTTIAPATVEYTEIKKSTIPGGGYYIELVIPKQQKLNTSSN